MHIGLLLILVAVPLIELVVLIKVGQLIGLWPTLFIVVGTGIAGTAILYHQGFLAFRRALESIDRGELPIAPVADSALLLLAGTLLVTPGLISDTAAMLLLVPPIRRSVARWMFGQLAVARQPPRRGPHARQDRGGPIIEGEFERIEEPPKDHLPRNPRH
jgi:UPF0716 protein FxsA